MKAYLIESPAGLFLIDKSGRIVDKILFPRNPKDAAVVFSRVQNGELPPQHEEMKERISKQEIERITVDTQAMASLARKLGDFRVDLEDSDPAIVRYRTRLSSMLVRLQIIESKEEYEKLVRDVSLELAQTAIGEAATRRDLYAIQTVRCIEDLDKVLNLLAGRIREWYGLHFPELDRMIEKHDSYIRLVQNIGTRGNFTVPNLEEQGIPADRSNRIAEAARKSAGAEFPDADLTWLREVCSSVLQLYKLREKAESYTDKVLMEVAPNMSAVIGPVLAAKIISVVGGLDGVAKLPASTLQVLGAEKALFRTIMSGARPPKHGIIFQYAPIHTGPRWLRGKIARAVAGKLAIAARLDAFGGENQGARMKKLLDDKVDELRRRYPIPPPPKKGVRPGMPSAEFRRRQGQERWRDGQSRGGPRRRFGRSREERSRERSRPDFRR